MESNVFKYVWLHTKKQQIWVLAFALLSMPTYFLALDLPKRIVNGPIQGRGFEDEGAGYRFLNITVDFSEWADWLGPYEIFSGFELDRLQSLWALSCTFLLLVCVNGLFKFYINTYKGRLGERMLRKLRYDLLDRVLRFPMAQFKRVKPSEMATMVKDEVEPLGGFIGDALVDPVFLGGQAITAMAFILLQNIWLGLISAGIIAIQALLIPRLRRRLIELGRQRQLRTRALAGRIGEIVEGVGSIHVNDTSNYERAEISNQLHHIFAIRYELFQRKFFVKFLNNFLAQLTPFLFYSVGGYFALTGRLDIGQLVAVIAAYKDLPAPIKDLINWDQQRLDVQVKFNQVIEQFTSDELLAEKLQSVVTEPVPPLTGEFSLSGVAAIDDSGAKLIERLSVDLQINKNVAIVGGLNSGAEYVGETLARLLPPTSGRVSVGGTPLEELPESVTGRRIAYIAADTPLQQGSVRDNIVYGLKRAPLTDYEYTDPAEQQQRAFEITEARLTGNSLLDIRADWIDYASARATGPDDLIDQIRRVLDIVEMDEELLHLGLRGLIDPKERPELTGRILEARRGLAERLRADDHKGLVELFDPEAFSRQATIGENLLFGTAVADDFDEARFGGHPYVRQILSSEGLDGKLFQIGREIAGTAIELFADLPADHPFFEQLSFMTADDIPEFQAVLTRIQGQADADIPDEDRQKIVNLSFLYIEPRHRMSLLDDDMMARILKARQAFREQLPEELSGAIEFYEPESYNRAASIQDNILSGRIAYGVAGGPERILKMILEVLREHDLLDAVFEVGLDYNVGTGGKRLSNAQRQKVAFARGLLKGGDVLVINRAMSALDRASQARIISNVLADANNLETPNYGVIWVLANAAMAEDFDRVIVLEDGKLAEDGTPEELLKKAGVYAKLVA